MSKGRVTAIALFSTILPTRISRVMYKSNPMFRGGFHITLRPVSPPRWMYIARPSHMLANGSRRSKASANVLT